MTTSTKESVAKPSGPSTKICPNCRSRELTRLFSHNLKLCTVCNTKIVWEREEGQEPLIKYQR